MADAKKCAHPACGCIAPEGKKYCSQVCEDGKDVVQLACHCQHPGCSGDITPA